MQKGSIPPEFVEPHRQRDLVVADELGVVWIAPPREHEVSVPSWARASARFGACWFSRQFVSSTVRGVSPMWGREAELTFRSNVHRVACPRTHIAPPMAESWRQLA
jgi:hypothetical protein